ncbi:LysR family transcriptional regulator [Arthrobacter pascens]|uniref:LysR family transcriptional regulator n=1 Tax=Arthrobacter pascens TaxID=1677 RepID=UPI00196AFC1B|nr:LysR family transcriptional regulator [Arthrobacter pascens]MBN3497870.1 LysR family transcriptional regulator [Arthrobacter pascens]
MATLNQLEAFVAAVATGTFTGAAADLKMSQPAISDLIRRLEAELDAKLFQRGARKLVLTAEGEELLPFARQSVLASQMGASAVRAVQSLGGGTATFGLLRNAEFYLRTDLAKNFHLAHPKVRIRLVGQNSWETARDVTSGQLDAGLVTLPIDDEELDVLPLARDEIVYVTADELRAQKTPSIADIAAAPLVLYDAHYAKTDPARRQLNDRAQLGGLTLEPKIEVEYLSTALALVAEGFGDTIVCRSAVASEVEPRGLKVVSMAEPMYDTLALVKRRGMSLSPATREMAKLAFSALVAHAKTNAGTVELIPIDGHLQRFLG